MEEAAPPTTPKSATNKRGSAPTPLSAEPAPQRPATVAAGGQRLNLEMPDVEEVVAHPAPPAAKGHTYDTADVGAAILKSTNILSEVLEEYLPPSDEELRHLFRNGAARFLPNVSESPFCECW